MDPTTEPVISLDILRVFGDVRLAVYVVMLYIRLAREALAAAYDLHSVSVHTFILVYVVYVVMCDSCLVIYDSNLVIYDSTLGDIRLILGDIRLVLGDIRLIHSRGERGAGHGPRPPNRLGTHFKSNPISKYQGLKRPTFLIRPSGNVASISLPSDCRQLPSLQVMRLEDCRAGKEHCFMFSLFHVLFRVQILDLDLFWVPSLLETGLIWI